MAEKKQIQASWSSEYDMTHKERGQVLIFNNRKYDGHMDERKFSDIDAGLLMRALKKIDFKSKVQLSNDLTADAILEKIRKVAKEDHSDRDCVVIVLLGYGEHNLFWAKDRPVGIQVLLDPLKGDVCHKSLVGKPKIIILQTDNPTIAEADNAEDDDGVKTVKVKHVIPTEADFVYLGSEMPGLITGRKAENGSIFISHLAKNLTEHGASTEIRRLMTRTMHDVEQEMDNWRSDWAMKNDEMMPFFVSLLTKDLKFPQKEKS